MCNYIHVIETKTFPHSPETETIRLNCIPIRDRGHDIDRHRNTSSICFTNFATCQRHFHDSCIRCFWDISIVLIIDDRLSRIRGVVANYLASQARDPGIDSHQHQKKIHDIYGAMRENILCLAAVCAAGWFSCMVVPEPIVWLACVLGRWAVFRITCTLIVNMCGMSLVI